MKELTHVLPATKIQRQTRIFSAEALPVPDTSHSWYGVRFLFSCRSLELVKQSEWSTFSIVFLLMLFSAYILTWEVPQTFPSRKRQPEERKGGCQDLYLVLDHNLHLWCQIINLLDVPSFISSFSREGSIAYSVLTFRRLIIQDLQQNFVK